MVSEIGFGAWQLGNEADWQNRMADNEGIKLVHAAIDRGCNFFDTAPNYGLGRSEELLGKALKGMRQNVVISTKFGHHADSISDFNPDRIRPSVERSLKLLQTDYIDIVLLHNPPFEALSGHEGHFEELEQLRAEGIIRAYGASLDWSKEVLELIRNTNSQVIEILFNVFHQEPSLAFTEVQKKGAGFIAKVPLDSGWLSGKYNSNTRFSDIRGRWTPEVVCRRADLLDKASFMTKDGTSMAQAALHFILGFREISAVIPGSKNLQQLEENLSAGEKSMPGDVFLALRQLWDKELKNNPLPW
jgi:aryl-alcohol dehydrogenase-like predicted oxidoreductase